MRMVGKISGAVLASAAALSAVPASAAVIFNSVTISVSTKTTLTGAAADADSTTATYSALPSNTFGISSTSSNIRNSQANATTSVGVFFSDAANLTFDVTSATSLAFRNAASGTASAGKYSFAYNFTTTTPWMYTVNWNVSAPNALQPANGPCIINAACPGGGLQLNPTATGGFTFGSPINAGTYTLFFNADFQDLLAKSGTAGQTFFGSSRDNFDFSISSVPEPTTWAMMIIGFGLVAGAARRRRSAGTSVLA